VVALSAVSTAVFLGAALLFGGAGLPSLLGLMIGRLLGAIAGAFLGTRMIYTESSWSPPDRESLSLVVRALPWIPHLLSHAFLRLGDRWVIGWLLGLESVGLYTGVWFFADAVGLVSGSLNRALSPHYARLRKDVSRHAYLRRMHAAYGWIVQSSVVVACALSPGIVLWLFGDAWKPAASVAAWTALSGLALGMYFPAVNRTFVDNLAGRTVRWTVLSALVNVGLNLWWIPYLGLAGAALASVVAYSVLWAGVAWTSRAVDPLIHGGALRWSAVAGSLVCCAVAWLSACSDVPSALVLVVALLTVSLVWAPFFVGRYAMGSVSDR
jgi:O-antigen/teichoic acid export membrane protein